MKRYKLRRGEELITLVSSERAETKPTMNKIVLALVFLASFIAISTAMACPPNVCQVMKCEEITEETCLHQNKVYVPHGSFCGCCSVCVSLPHIKVIPPGDVPVKLCPYPFIGTGEQDYYLC